MVRIGKCKNYPGIFSFFRFAGNPQSQLPAEPAHRYSPIPVAWLSSVLPLLPVNPLSKILPISSSGIPHPLSSMIRDFCIAPSSVRIRIFAPVSLRYFILLEKICFRINSTHFSSVDTDMSSSISRSICMPHPDQMPFLTPDGGQDDAAETDGPDEIVPSTRSILA